MAASVTIRVTGLTELRRALRDLDKDADKNLSETFKTVAQGIVRKIDAEMPVKTGFARGTVQAHVRLRGASISIGTGNSDDYVPWLDFGGRVGRQASISRPFIKEGRYLYPQIMAARPATLKAIDEAIRRAAEKSGFTTSGSGG